MHTKATLRMKRTFEASAQTVFDAFTSEEVMRRWWHAGHDWETPRRRSICASAETFRCGCETHEDVRYGGGGRYTEIDPPNRLAFTWVWDDDEDVSSS